METTIPFLQAKLKERRCFHFWMMILLSSAVSFGFTFVMLLAGSFAFISVSVVVSFKQCFISEVIWSVVVAHFTSHVLGELTHYWAHGMPNLQSIPFDVPSFCCRTTNVLHFAHASSLKEKITPFLLVILHGSSMRSDGVHTHQIETLFPHAKTQRLEIQITKYNHRCRYVLLFSWWFIPIEKNFRPRHSF